MRFLLVRYVPVAIPTFRDIYDVENEKLGADVVIIGPPIFHSTKARRCGYTILFSLKF